MGKCMAHYYEIWTDKMVKSSKQTFHKRLSTGLNNSLGKGNKQSLLKGGLLLSVNT